MLHDVIQDVEIRRRKEYTVLNFYYSKEIFEFKLCEISFSHITELTLFNKETVVTESETHRRFKNFIIHSLFSHRL